MFLMTILYRYLFTIFKYGVCISYMLQISYQISLKEGVVMSDYIGESIIYEGVSYEENSNINL